MISGFVYDMCSSFMAFGGHAGILARARQFHAGTLAFTKRLFAQASPNIDIWMVNGPLSKVPEWLTRGIDTQPCAFVHCRFLYKELF